MKNEPINKMNPSKGRWKGKHINDMKKHELLEYIHILINNPLTDGESYATGYLKGRQDATYDIMLDTARENPLIPKKTQQVINKAKAKEVKRKMLCQADDVEVEQIFKEEDFIKTEDFDTTTTVEKPLWSRIKTWWSKFKRELEP